MSEPATTTIRKPKYRTQRLCTKHGWVATKSIGWYRENMKDCPAFCEECLADLLLEKLGHCRLPTMEECEGVS